MSFTNDKVGPVLLTTKLLIYPVRIVLFQLKYLVDVAQSKLSELFYL